MSGRQIWIDSSHRLLARGLALILAEAGFSAQAEPQGAAACIRDYASSRTRTLEPPGLPTLALVQRGTAEPELFELLRLGHRGYVTSDDDDQTLVSGTRAVCSGDLWVEPGVLVRYLSRQGGGQLTSREREVLFYLRRGWTNLQIADQLQITQKTVKTHVSAVLSKHGVHHRTELMLGFS